jgi:hypothetical protein
VSDLSSSAILSLVVADAQQQTHRIDTLAQQQLRNDDEIESTPSGRKQLPDAMNGVVAK